LRRDQDKNKQSARLLELRRNPLVRGFVGWRSPSWRGKVNCKARESSLGWRQGENSWGLLRRKGVFTGNLIE